MLQWLIGNSLLTGVVMLVVYALCRVNRKRPALCHLLWVLAFASLIMPPVPIQMAPGTQLRERLNQWWQTQGEPTSTVVLSALPTFRGDLDGKPGAVDSTALSTAQLQLGEGPARTPWFAQFSLRQWLVGVWLLGALLLCGLAAFRILRFHRLVRRAPTVDSSLRTVVQDVAGLLGIQAPAVRQLEGIGSPAIWCFGPPLLLWPTAGGKVVRHGGERSLIAHELAHVARRDHWVSRLDVLAIGLCWWNPLFWIIRHEVRHYAELSCDAWALWAYPTCRRDFAEALIESQERTQGATMAIEGLCATNSEFKNFERRLIMIMNTNVSRQVSKGAATVALLTTLLVLPGFSGGDECNKQAVCDGRLVRTCIDQELELKELSNKAGEHFTKQEFAQATELYKQVLALAPMDGNAHGRLGYMLVAEGQLEAAKMHFKQQFKSGHEVAIAVYNLSCANALGGDLEQAGEYLTQAVRRGFADHQLLAKDSDLASLRASESFAWALKASTKHSALRLELKSEEVGEDVVKRAAIYDTLAEICSEDGALQNEAGLNYLLAKNYAGGLKAFERQIAAGYDVARANYNVACAHALSGQPAAALSALETSVELGMSYAKVREDQDLASLHGMARFEQAAERLQAPEAFKKQLKAASTAEEVGEASATLMQLKDDEGKNAQVRSWAAFELGRLQLRTDQAQASIGSFQEAARIGYEVDLVAFQIGNAHAQLGAVDEALRFYERAVQLGFADVASMERSLQACGMADSKVGATLVKQAGKQHKAKSKDKAGYGAESKAQAKLDSKTKDAKKKAMQDSGSGSSVSGLRF